MVTEFTSVTSFLEKEENYQRAGSVHPLETKIKLFLLCLSVL